MTTTERPRVGWVECPRDAWQGLAHTPPFEARRAHLEGLFAAGFGHVDGGAFVSRRAVPRMADSDALLAGLSVPAGAELSAVVMNVRGLARAVDVGSVTTVGLPVGASETFERRNAKRSRAEGLRALREVADAAGAVGLRVQAYLSMAFGNPYGDPWSPGAVAENVARLREAGAARVVLADTVGRADAERVAAVLHAVDPEARGETLGVPYGVHLHARPDGWAPLLEAALRGGARSIEGALSGAGGCPFAEDELVGNLPTERVLPWLRARGCAVPGPPHELAPLAREATALAGS